MLATENWRAPRLHGGVVGPPHANPSGRMRPYGPGTGRRGMATASSRTSRNTRAYVMPSGAAFARDEGSAPPPHAHEVPASTDPQRVPRHMKVARRRREDDGHPSGTSHTTSLSPDEEPEATPRSRRGRHLHPRPHLEALARRHSNPGKLPEHTPCNLGALHPPWRAGCSRPHRGSPSPTTSTNLTSDAPPRRVRPRQSHRVAPRT